MVTSWGWLSSRPAVVTRMNACRAQGRQRRRAGVAHAAAQAADELVHHVAQRAGVGDAALDALGHELAGRRADGDWAVA